MKFVNRQLLKVVKLIVADERFVVIRNEGGLASQIGFWALGHEFEHLGYEVKFDNSWFRSHGLDINGIFPRNLDFPKAFPSLQLAEASKAERFLLKKVNNYREGDFSDLVVPAYLGGFYDRWTLVQKHREILCRNFAPKNEIFSERDIEMLAQIEGDANACGAHVRRGDLAKDHQVYGKALNADYFMRAMDEIRSTQENTRFYFFSDEPEWVRENIVKKLDPEISSFIMDSNGSDRGFVDMYLLSRCRSFISSQGSFGKYARLLGDPCRFIVEPSSNVSFDEGDENRLVLQV